ncbi:MAG: response regulator transcription factor [Campylobacterota bacterium]
MRTFSILLVEDEMDSALWIKEFFDPQEFSLTACDTVTQSIALLGKEQFDLILLDLNLPDYSGFELLQFCARNHPLIPIIITSAYSEKNTLLKAFKLGAKDYMKKPIDLEELEARIWVQLKTNTRFVSARKKEKFTFWLQDGNICFQDHTLQLTHTQKALFATLIQNSNQAVSREHLALCLSSGSSERTLDYHIQNLRKQIQDQTGHTECIKTQYGYGYCFIQ